jgi:hypothetical protein
LSEESQPRHLPERRRQLPAGDPARPRHQLRPHHPRDVFARRNESGPSNFPIFRSTANLTKVQPWDCGTAGGQIWKPQPDGALLNPQSGRCLDSPSGATADGIKLQIYDCNGLDPQKWNVPV